MNDDRAAYALRIKISEAVRAATHCWFIVHTRKDNVAPRSIKLLYFLLKGYPIIQLCIRLCSLMCRFCECIGLLLSCFPLPHLKGACEDSPDHDTCTELCDPSPAESLATYLMDLQPFADSLHFHKSQHYDRSHTRWRTGLLGLARLEVA